MHVGEDKFAPCQVIPDTDHFLKICIALPCKAPPWVLSLSQSGYGHESWAALGSQTPFDPWHRVFT